MKVSRETAELTVSKRFTSGKTIVTNDSFWQKWILNVENRDLGTTYLVHWDQQRELGIHNYKKSLTNCQKATKILYERKENTQRLYYL